MYTFVPPPQPPSAEARELAVEIVRFVEEYREIRSDVSDHDVAQAMSIASLDLRGGIAMHRRLMVVIALLTAVGVGAAVLFNAQGGAPMNARG